MAAVTIKVNAYGADIDLTFEAFDTQRWDNPFDKDTVNNLIDLAASRAKAALGTLGEQ